MCRSIRPLFNFDPPATSEDVRAASVQFVRKLSGFSRPSRANEAAFDRAVTDIATAAQHLLESLVTSARPLSQAEWTACRQQRYAARAARRPRAAQKRLR